jgi:hypothetical protein
MTFGPNGAMVWEGINAVMTGAFKAYLIGLGIRIHELLGPGPHFEYGIRIQVLKMLMKLKCQIQHL